MKTEIVDKVVGIFKKPKTKADLNFNMEVDIRPVADCDCIMCGEHKAEVVIANPNGELLGEKDTWEWDVCKECSEFVSWGMSRTLSVVAELALMRAKDGS